MGVARTACSQYSCVRTGTIYRTSQCVSGDSHAVSQPIFCEKPQPRGCRQTPGTGRHSRAYLFNRMCYSITASLSQQQSFKCPFISGISGSPGLRGQSGAAYLFGFRGGACLVDSWTPQFVWLRKTPVKTDCEGG